MHKRRFTRPRVENQPIQDHANQFYDQPTAPDAKDAVDISDLYSGPEADTLPAPDTYLERRQQKSPERERLEDFSEDLASLIAQNADRKKLNQEFKGVLMPFKRIYGKGGKMLRIENVLARGGQGIVIEVSEVDPETHEPLPGNYVLKFALTAESDQGGRNELTREQIALSRMQREWNAGPNSDMTPPMPEFHGATQFKIEGKDKRVFLTLQEKIEGQDLYDTKIQNIDQFAMIARNLLELIDELHELGVYHGDIKLLNIMLSDTGNLRTVDFGAARIPELIMMKQSRFDPIDHPTMPRESYSTPVTDMDEDGKHPPGYALPNTKRLVYTKGYISNELQQFDRDEMYLELPEDDAESIATAYEKDGRFLDTFQVAATIENLFYKNMKAIRNSCTNDMDKDLVGLIFHLTAQLKQSHNDLAGTPTYELSHAITDINDMVDQYFHNKNKASAA